MSTIDWDDLVRRARAVRENAHAPYSNYRVGAALITTSGAVHVGCNVENASYGLTVCAERTAICSMIAAGDRDPIAIVIMTAGPAAGSPCGMCRQVLAEFAMDLPVRLVTADPSTPPTETTLGELLPLAFRADKLGR